LLNKYIAFSTSVFIHMLTQFFDSGHNLFSKSSHFHGTNVRDHFYSMGICTLITLQLLDISGSACNACNLKGQHSLTALVSYRPVWASSPSFTLFSLFLIQRSQNWSLFLSVPLAQLVKAWRGVFFQAVLSSNPGQIKNLSFKDNCPDSEIFIAY